MLLFHTVLFYVSDVDIAVWFVLFFIIFHYIFLSWMQFQDHCNNVCEMGAKATEMWHEPFSVSSFKTLILLWDF